MKKYKAGEDLSEGDMVEIRDDGRVYHVAEERSFEDKFRNEFEKCLSSGMTGHIDLYCLYDKCVRVAKKEFYILLKNLEQHLKDLELTGDIQINSQMSWEGLILKYKQALENL